MLASLASCTLVGIDAMPVEVEVDVDVGLPAYHVVGLPAPVVKEGAVRIQSALGVVGHALPNKKVIVNLAPADVRKAGAAFDLPIALGVMIAEGIYPRERVEGLIVLGELGLDGYLRPVRGVIAAAMLARERKMRGVLVPSASAGEARVVDGVEVHAAEHLADVCRWLGGEGDLRATGRRPRPPRPPRAPLDMAEVRGQAAARAAIEVAVAGGHNILLAGPPGIGHPGYTGRERDLERDPLTHTVVLEIQEPIAETREHWAERVATSAPTCACGCGRVITVNAVHRTKGLPKYVHGHHPNPIRRAYDAVRAQGFEMIGTICRELGVSETTYRRLEAAGRVPRARRIEVMKGRFVRVVTTLELERIVARVGGSNRSAKKRGVNKAEMSAS